MDTQEKNVCVDKVINSNLKRIYAVIYWIDNKFCCILEYTNAYFLYNFLKLPKFLLYIF